jgi:hypothetical protein
MPFLAVQWSARASTNTSVVKLKRGARLETEELIALCKEKLGSVMAPKWVEICRGPRCQSARFVRNAT